MDRPGAAQGLVLPLALDSHRLRDWFAPRRFFLHDDAVPARQGPSNEGCYLEVFPNEKLVSTNALLVGFHPSVVTETCRSDDMGFAFTAMIEQAAEPNSTRYTATVKNANETGCQKHAAMGFEAGWGLALDQLVAMIKSDVHRGAPV
jgi:uncharacterized protein YndB with AHSA1/START domain